MKQSTGINRLASIDLLRFIAAMMVATYHWGVESNPDYYRKVYEFPILGQFIQNGAFGVSIFFVISGFVIIGAAQKYNVVEFIFARFNRLFPGLLICMIVILPVGSKFINPWEKPIPSFINSTFLTYTITGIEPLATQLWTLLVEIKFYAGIGILLLLMPRLMRNVSGLVMMVIVWQFLIILLQNLGGNLGFYLLPYLTLNGNSSFFILGICLYLLTKSKRDFGYENWLIWLVSIFIFDQIIRVAGYSKLLLICLFITSLMIIFSRYLQFGPRFQLLAYWLGLSSYPIYLLHEHLGLAFFLQIQDRITQNVLVVVVLTSFCMTIFSVLLAIFVESPIQRIFKIQFTRVNRRLSRTENR
jgi:peptidoglycan/LPS O-acetylase OafA/YrhL